MTTEWTQERPIDITPSWENMCRHVDRFGLDNEHTGYRGKVKTYTTYKSFRNDSAIEVARAFFGPKTYVAFVEKYGELGWAEAALADHEAVRVTE